MLRSILLASAALVSAPIAARTFDSAAVSGLGARNIGSATMSGRISAVTGRQEADGKVTLLIGSASGGVWKSEDGGTTFTPVFDKEPVKSIGAVALDPSNKQIMWVGTGESWTRNSVSIGNGVYKWTDGGETWTNMGLPGTSGSPESSLIRRTAIPSMFVLQVRFGPTRPIAVFIKRQTEERAGR